MSSQLMQYLRLIRDVPVAALGDFLVRLEREMPGDYPGALLRERVMDRMLAEDPQQALDLLMSRRSHYAWLTRNDDIIEAMAGVKFEDTWDRIEGLPTGHDDRANYLAHLAGYWAREHSVSALDLVEGMGARERKALLSNHHHFSDKHPEWAIDLALRAPPSDEADELLETVFSEWSRHDPAGVIAKINTIENHSRKIDAIEELAWSWAGTNPDAAIAYASEIDSPKLRDRFVSSLGVAMWNNGINWNSELMSLISNQEVRSSMRGFLIDR